MRISDWSSDVCSSDLLNDIFAAAGFSRVSADVQAVGIGVANLVATVIGMSLIDRVGRKPLLMVGAGGTGIALAGVATIYSRSEERREGKECVSTCRSRWSPAH